MSVLVDTSIWIDHLNRSDTVLVSLLEQGLASTHPYVIGELACGNLRNRNEVIDLIAGLPMGTKADDDEILQFITMHQLHGKGLGLVDIHLLATCRIDRMPLWTRDKRLASAAEILGIAPAIA